jgi:hypothetical protein
VSNDETRIFGQLRRGDNRTIEGLEELVAELADAYTKNVGSHGQEMVPVADIAAAVKENGVLLPGVR